MPTICRKARQLGLTNYSRTKQYQSEAMSKRQLDWLEKNPHPRGMSGKHHSPENRKKIGNHAKRKMGCYDQNRT